ncbi:hypothetical protein P7K49_039789, partial [Saguinus oedipus]
MSEATDAVRMKRSGMNAVSFLHLVLFAPKCLLLTPWSLRPEQAGPRPLHLPPAAAAGGHGEPRDGQRCGPQRGRHGPLQTCVLGYTSDEEAFRLAAFQGKELQLLCFHGYT